MTNEREIEIYFTTDMPGILRKVGLYEDAEAGRLRCYVCGKPVDLRNIGGIFKHKGQIRVVCNSINCLYEAAWLVRTERLSEEEGP